MKVLLTLLIQSDGPPSTHRLQNLLITEYALNYTRTPKKYDLRYIPKLKGFWKLWVVGLVGLWGSPGAFLQQGSVVRV